MGQIPFFLSTEYLQIQEDSIRLEEKGVFISIAGRRDGKSPGRAPFGGFYFPEKTDESAFEILLQRLENHALHTGMHTLEILMPPGFYWKEGEKHWFENKMIAFGYKKEYTELNFHLDIQHDFRKNLRPSERWKLRKAEKKGFYFNEVLHPDWNFIYPFLMESRSRKGYQLSMSYKELAACFENFPGRYQIWEVKSPDGKTAALGISVNVCPEKEYLFYTADAIEFRNVSPVVMLHEGIVTRMQESGKKILDLGTASLRGELNSGVAVFKTAIGGIPDGKTKWKKLWFQKPEKADE